MTIFGFQRVQIIQKKLIVGYDKIQSPYFFESLLLFSKQHLRILSDGILGQKEVQMPKISFLFNGSRVLKNSTFSRKEYLSATYALKSFESNRYGCLVCFSLSVGSVILSVSSSLLQVRWFSSYSSIFIVATSAVLFLLVCGQFRTRFCVVGSRNVPRRLTKKNINFA